jgi:hypothetical protein
MAGAGRAELKERVHDAEREKRGAQGNCSAPGSVGPRGREGRGAWRGKQLAPTGRPQRAESERERERERERESCR